MYFRGSFLRPPYRKQCDMLVRVCVSITDVSQSASPHAEACPSLGWQPRQEASALTPGVPEAGGERSIRELLTTEASAHRRRRQGRKGLILQ